jgi:segregation and condensation protein A
MTAFEGATNMSAQDSVEIETLAIEPGEGAAIGASGDESAFRVRLANFEGPFDLLLSLITRRQLDITEVALSQVTDEFISYISGVAKWDLGQATEFLVVAATLLDLKTARLLPAADVEDEEDLALLEARDLLFARLLQYRAYKLAAAYLGELERAQGRRYGRAVELEPRFARLLPEVFLGLSPGQLADLAAVALTPRPVPTVSVEHVHAPKVSVREQMAILRSRLRGSSGATFRALVADCTSTMEVVGRFLALLELYREGTVAFDQAAALTELRVRWTGRPGDSGAEDSGEDAEDDQTLHDTVDEEYG